MDRPLGLMFQHNAVVQKTPDVALPDLDAEIVPLAGEDLFMNACPLDAPAVEGRAARAGAAAPRQTNRPRP